MSGPICLVVDDEPRVRGYLTTVLRSGGFEIMEAEDGLQALEVLRTCSQRVDLVISDVSMPIMSGDVLADHVKMEFPSTPIILVTGYTPTLASSGVPILQKPFLPAILLTAANDALRRSSAACA